MKATDFISFHTATQNKNTKNKEAGCTMDVRRRSKSLTVRTTIQRRTNPALKGNTITTLNSFSVILAVPPESLTSLKCKLTEQQCGEEQTLLKTQ